MMVLGSKCVTSDQCVRGGVPLARADTMFDAAGNGEVDLVRELLACGVVQPNATDQVFHWYSSAFVTGNMPIEEGSVDQSIMRHPAIRYDLA